MARAAARATLATVGLHLDPLVADKNIAIDDVAQLRRKRKESQLLGWSRRRRRRRGTHVRRGRRLVIWILGCVLASLLDWYSTRGLDSLHVRHV